MSVVAANTGWRVVLADRENGGSVALPIVAWLADDSPADARFLDCYYVPNEGGCLPQLLGDNEHLLGYLAPGDEHEAYWGEIGDETIKRLDEEEERGYQKMRREVRGESG